MVPAKLAWIGLGNMGRVGNLKRGLTQSVINENEF